MKCHEISLSISQDSLAKSIVCVFREHVLSNVTVKLDSLTAILSQYSKVLSHFNRLYSFTASIFTMNVLSKYSTIIDACNSTNGNINLDLIK